MSRKFTTSHEPKSLIIDWVEVMASDADVRQQQPIGWSVILFTMLCLETLGPAIHVDVNVWYLAKHCWFLMI